MGDRYAHRGVATRSSFMARHKLNLVLPFCLLLVLLVMYSSTRRPLLSASSWPEHDVNIAGESEALRGAYTTLQHKETINAQSEDLSAPYLKVQTDIITTTQYDNIKTHVTPSLDQKLNHDPSASSDIKTSQDDDDLSGGGDHHSTQPNIDHPQADNPDLVANPNPSALSDPSPAVITGNRSTLVNLAAMEIYDELRAASLPYSTRKVAANTPDPTCQGKYVYVYDLPPEFNVELANRCDSLFPWFNLCDYLADSGTGKPVNSQENGTQVLVPADRWFSTHQYSLELVSHARILKHKCRTEDPNLASLFYVPYYGGLDVIRWHFDLNATNEKRDALGMKLVRWLQAQPTWARRRGFDHVLVLGKISWDFRRQVDGSWGSRLLEFPELEKMTKVMIERNPWARNDIGVPHPTYFHPRSASDIDTWLRHVESHPRPSLVTFVGKERRNDPANVRSALVSQCRAAAEPACKFVECSRDRCQRPAYVTEAFLASEFCMQPVGDSPTRRSVFDSLIAGCIPVLFHPSTAYLQYLWHLPRNESSWSVYISEDEVRAGRVNVVETLKRVSKAERDAMRETVINVVIPGLLYAVPGSDVGPYQDAFDITVKQLLYRAAHRPDLEQLA